MSKARDLADTVSTGGILADGAVSVSEISDLTATAAELNTLDGITASTADLNNVTNINTNVQTQLDLKAPLASPSFTGNVGIGNTNPTVKLDVQSSSGVIGRIQSTSGDAQFNIAVPNVNDGILAFGDASSYRASIKANTSDALTFQTGSSLTERFRIGSSGQLGVGGATYGTAGQVLTSGGSGAAPTWADAGGGATQINELSDGYSDGSSVGLGPNALLNDDGTTNVNVAVGLNALRTNTSGNNTVAIGEEAAYSQTNGGQNVFIGTKAGRNATSRVNVTVVGSFAAYSMSSSGDLNTYIGSTAGYSHNAGGTTVVGGNALQQATSAYGATAVGTDALKDNTTGNYNTAVGHHAGEKNTTGYGNTFIGGDAGYNATTITNCVVLGFNATPASNTVSSNEITLGNNSINLLRCNTQTISSLSDERDKKNIKDIEIGLDFLKTLRPVSFDWDQRDGGRVDKPDIGFIAQELLEAQEQCDVSVPNLVSTINPEKLEAAYATLIPVLVQAIKELSEELDTLKNKGV